MGMSTSIKVMSTSVGSGPGHPHDPGHSGHILYGEVGLIRFIKYPGLTRIRSRDRTLCTNSILLIKTTYSTTWSHAHYSRMYLA